MSHFPYDITQLEVDQAKKKAISHTDGPLLIIAGPGAGKTKTLVERIVHLLSRGVTPEQMLVATFTEKAAKELITRVSSRLWDLNVRINLNEMYIGTLHSIFLRILEDYREHTRLKRSYRLLDAFDQHYFVYQRINEFLTIEGADQLLGGHQRSSWYKSAEVIQLINKISEECLAVESLLQAEDLEVRILAQFYQRYCQQLEEENALDFSFIQVEILRLLEDQPKVLSELQERLRYFMVDEYQDTNTIQENILLLLSAASQNLCVVGDDDQGLYRFRGASIRNILEFKQNFPKGTCQQVTLSTNYRSHPDIIRFYNEWMQQINWQRGSQSFRYPKQIVPRNDTFPKVPTVLKLSSRSSEEDYFEEVYQFIRTLQQQGTLTDFNQLAFLFRSVRHPQVISLSHYLEERGIPVFSPRSKLFFERDEIQLLLGALVFIFPNLFEQLKWSNEAQLDVWKYYQQCKQRFAEAIRADPEKHQALLTWAQQRARAHLTLTGKTSYAFAALLYQLLEYPMFSELLSTELSANKTQLRASYNIALLTKLLYKFEYLHNVTVFTPENLEAILQNLFNRYLRFIIDGGIEEYEDFDEYAPSGCVSFMTIHQSKGLEFPVVVVDSLGSYPRKQHTSLDALLQNHYYHKPPFEPLDATKLFDFWRLYYTAFSRPQNLLLLTAHEQFNQNGSFRAPSKYFFPQYDKLPSWRDERFDPSQIELASVKPIHLKHEYSFTSHILLYENCPLQYKFYKELEFTEVRTGGVLGGTLLHQTIEDIHKAVLRGEVASLTDEKITSWYNTNYQLLVKQQRTYLHQGQQIALLRQVLNYRDRNAHRWDQIVEAEVDVSLVKENYILKGAIDLIRGENDTVEIVDFKSGDKPDVNATDELTRKQLNQYRRQLEIYAHLVEERTGHRVSRMHLYYPKEESGNPYVSFAKQKDTIDQTITTFDEVVRRIEHQDYSMKHITKSEKLCGSCDMRYHCNPKQYS
ncbi:ATP-dependent helicase [Tunicatimonas pelagia]|uniref:ATP-dependent helicase n=1 Tax=Tunicatimonas pelagia TaxID=931531 RepID=UPI0026650846|nr:ATP-dependent DNA helicase [Tunicatimonas pelagia]WKN46434.1 ATP-dependent DNA helicase [Tunicatimonas pelagia]